MRIAVVHSYYRSLEPSGENHVVDDQIAALKDAGHDVRIAARRSDDLQQDRGHGARSAARVGLGIGARPQLAWEGWIPDVIHVHNTFPNYGTSWLAQWGSKTVATLHNYRTVCAAATLFRDGNDCRECLHLPVLPALKHKCYRHSMTRTLPLALAASPNGSLRSLARRAQRVIVLNQTAHSIMSASLKRTVDVIPNFVDKTAGQKDRPSTKRDGFAFVGRLAPEKGILALIENWPSTSRLHIYGAGPLEAEVQTLVSGRAHLTFHGRVDRQSIANRLPSLRAVVVPSLWAEGVPSIALETLAAETPLMISSHVAAASEFSNAGAGIIFDPRSAPSILQAIEAVVGNCERMSGAAALLHERSYTRHAWLSQIEPLYEEIAKGTGKQPGA